MGKEKMELTEELVSIYKTSLSEFLMLDAAHPTSIRYPDSMKLVKAYSY